MVQRRTVLTLLLVVAAVVALGVSAATLNETTTTTKSGGAGAGSVNEETGIGSNEQGAVEVNSGRPASRPSLQFSLCVNALQSPAFFAGLGLVALVVIGWLYRRTESWVLTGMSFTSLSIPVVALLLLLTACGGGLPTDAASNQSQANVSVLPDLEGGGESGTGGEGNALSTPSSVLGIVLLLAVIGSAGLLLFATADDEPDTPEEDDPEPESNAAVAVGDVAGDTADKLEADADLENTVYQAWREMTLHLDVDTPRSSTPAEFAAAAVDAGMDREDVTELTELFETVRYGGDDPTPAEERRAIDALRNIEATYADSDDESTADRLAQRPDERTDDDPRTDGGTWQEPDDDQRTDGGTWQEPDGQTTTGRERDR